MLPSLSLTASSSSSISATTRVNKATSELLHAPDWTLNIDICDFCNSNHWLAKDVVKEVKKRLQHKNPKVQLLTLTLLETMVKNCGEYIHYHIAERKLLDEMIKIIKKKGDVHVREKLLVLLDSWQEAFGGPSGKYPQYYWACDELRRSGVNFPPRSPRSPPVITPPVSRTSRVDQVGFGMPPNPSRRLDEAMSSEVESLSNSTLESIQNAVELLDDMLEAVNPNDRMSVKDEVIVELADRCRTYQKKLMQMITTTTDEDLLARGLEMNDSLQSALARHDGIASGSPLPSRKKITVLKPSESRVSVVEGQDETPIEDGKSRAIELPGSKDPNEEDEEEDEFALLARRHSKAQSATSQSGTGSTKEGATSSESVNALVLVDAPITPTPTSNGGKEQDLIDLLSIVLTTSSTSSETPETLPPPSSDPNSAPNSAIVPNSFETSFNNYVVPWAQPQPITTQPSQGYSGYSPSYPPPPWEATPSYSHNQMPTYNNNNPYLYPNNSSVSMQGYNSHSQYGNQPTYSTPLASNNSPSLQTRARVLQNSNSFHNPPSTNGNLHLASKPINGGSSIQGGPRPLQHVNSFPAKVGNGSTVLNNGSSGIPSSGQKPFVPSYRLFEDLNVLGSSESKLKNGPYPSASGTRI